MTERSTPHATRGASEPPSPCSDWSTWTKSRLQALSRVYRPIRWCVSIWMRAVPDQSDEREVALCAVASGGLRPFRAFSCRLRLSNPPFRLGASHRRPSGEPFEDAPRDIKPSVEELAIPSPQSRNPHYARRGSLSNKPIRATAAA
jgi:hypothetical protein